MIEINQGIYETRVYSGLKVWHKVLNFLPGQRVVFLYSLKKTQPSVLTQYLRIIGVNPITGKTDEYSYSKYKQ